MSAHSANTQPSSASPPRAGVRHRLLFLFLRRPALVLAVFAALLLTAIVAGAALLDRSGDPRAAWGLCFGAFNLAVAGIAIGAIRLNSAPVASPWLVEAALRAATVNERPHLLALLQQRVGQAWHQEPVSWSELAGMFNSVRAEHGQSARARAERLALAVEGQKRLLQVVEHGQEEG